MKKNMIFLRLIIKATFRALEDFEFYRNRYRDVLDLSPSASRVLHCFKERPENRLQRRLIIEDTGLFPARVLPMPLAVLKKSGFVQRFGRGAGIRYQLIF